MALQTSAINMRDKGINIGLVQDFETSNKRSKGVFWGFRKMFWTYLNKLHVPFFDPCCDTATDTPTILPAGFDTESGEFVVWSEESQAFVTAAEWIATTTTTTTSTSTTSTTTAATTTTTSTSTTTTTTL